MSSNGIQRLREQGSPWLGAMPRGRAAGVGEGNQIKADSGSLASKRFSNDIDQRLWGKELGDRQFANRQHQFRLENPHLGIDPFAATHDLVRGRDAIAAVGVLAGKTATDGCHVDGLSEKRFGYAATFGEPTEERLAGGPRKRASEDRFLDARSLAHKEHFAQHGAAGYDRFVHRGTIGARVQAGDVCLKRCETVPHVPRTVPGATE